MSEPAHPAAASRRPRVGLVIGSGALKCASALGLWRVLVREGIDVDMAVGSSGGGIYAGMLAFGWDVERVVEMSSQMWKEVFGKYDYWALVQALFPRLLKFDGRFGLVDDREANRVIESIFGDRTFADAKIPLSIVATDLLLAEKVVLTSGRVSDAIRGSIAMPFALRPWRVDGRLLCDGGATDPLPVDVAVKDGCDIILAMGFENSPAPAIPSLMRLVLQTNAMTTNSLLHATYAFYSVAHHAEILLMVPKLERHVGIRDTHLHAYLVEQGEMVAEREMPYLKRLLAEQGYTGAFAPVVVAK